MAVDFSIKRERIGQAEGFIEIEVQLIRNFKFQIFEYYNNGDIIDYRYHVMNENGELLVRWDNAPHFPSLVNFPHHKHLVDNTLNASQPTVMQVLKEIPDLW